MNNKILFLILFAVSYTILNSCKKCADNNFVDYNSIQLYFLDSLGRATSYSPTIIEAESNKILKSSKVEFVTIIPRPKFIGDYLPFDFNHSTNTFIFSDSTKIDTISISGLNPQAIYTENDCGFQVKVNQPVVLKNTFTKHYQCNWGNWNEATQTITLKIISP